jgi:hypothetical protein
MEDEVVHVLQHDNEAGHIYLVDNGVSDTILPKLKSLQPEREIVLLKEEVLVDHPIETEGSVIVWQKPIMLHVLPRELRDDVTASLKLIEGRCGAILVFYGLCGNAFRNFEAITKDIPIPVNILKDHSDQIVDDCIGAAVGGTDEYLHLLRSNSGTFFLTPMWASNWRRFFADIQVIQGDNDLEGAKYVFQFMNYRGAMKMMTGLNDPERFQKNVEEFADIFDFKVWDKECSTKVAERSYQRTKEMLSSNVHRP